MKLEIPVNMALADGISTEINYHVCVNIKVYSLVVQVFVCMLLSFNPRIIIYDTRVFFLIYFKLKLQYIACILYLIEMYKMIVKITTWMRLLV